jgi:hypothetical protein
LQVLRVQAVEDGGHGVVAWGFAQAQEREKPRVFAGEAGYAAKGVYAAKEGHQDEGQESPKRILSVVGAGVGDLG